MSEHTGDLQDKWTRRCIFTTESQIGLAAQYITQLNKEKEELRIECNRLYGIGQEYDEENAALKRELISERKTHVQHLFDGGLISAEEHDRAMALVDVLPEE